MIVHPQLTPAFPDDFNYAVCPTEDAYDVSLYSVLSMALPSVLGCFRRDNPSVCLVHCTKGISRSSAVVIAAFICLGWSFERALQFCVLKRCAVYPNLNFQVQLRYLEQKLKNSISLRCRAGIDASKYADLFDELGGGQDPETFAAAYAINVERESGLKMFVRTASLRPKLTPSKLEVWLDTLHESVSEGTAPMIQKYLLDVFAEVRDAVGVLLHHNSVTEYSTMEELTDEEIDLHLQKVKAQNSLRTDLLHHGAFWIRVGLLIENMGFYHFNVNSLPDGDLVVKQIGELIVLFNGLEKILSTNLPGVKHVSALKRDLVKTLELSTFLPSSGGLAHGQVPNCDSRTTQIIATIGPEEPAGSCRGRSHTRTPSRSPSKSRRSRRSRRSQRSQRSQSKAAERHRSRDRSRGSEHRKRDKLKRLIHPDR